MVVSADMDRCADMSWHLPNYLHYPLAQAEQDSCNSRAAARNGDWTRSLAWFHSCFLWRAFHCYNRSGAAVRIRHHGFCPLSDSLLCGHNLSQAGELRLGKLQKRKACIRSRAQHHRRCTISSYRSSGLHKRHPEDTRLEAMGSYRSLLVDRHVPGTLGAMAVTDVWLKLYIPERSEYFGTYPY